MGGVVTEAPAAATIEPRARSRAAGTAWRALKADRPALVAAATLLLIVLACFPGAPLAAKLAGHSADKYFVYATHYGANGIIPVGPWAHVPDQQGVYPPPTAHTPRTLFVLGSDQLGRDELLRLLYGGRTTLEIGVLASVAALLIGVLVGTVAGFVGGFADAVLSRTTEFVAAFPLLLLVTALGWTISQRLNAVTVGRLLEPGVLSMIVLIALFTWPYPARIVRQQVLELREREFVDAARMIGAGGFRIVRTHLLPHLAATIAVYASLIVAANIVLEAALSVLNFGLQRDIPDWGQMLQANYGSIISGGGFGGPVWDQVFPAAAILVTIVCLSLVGEALRRAADPRSGRAR